MGGEAEPPRDLVLENLVLSTSQRPKLYDSEIELCWMQGIDLEFKDKSHRYRNGNLAVTSHRLLWLASDPLSSLSGAARADGKGDACNCWLPLAAIRGHRGLNSIFKKTSRVYLDVWWRSETGKVATVADVEAAGAAHAQLSPPKLSSEADSLSLAFRGPSGSYDTFLKNLDLAMGRQEWKKDSASKQTVGEAYDAQKKIAPQRLVSAGAAGVGGLVRKQREDNIKSSQSIDVAFKDLSALMDKAREMVDLSTKLKDALRENAAKSDDTEREDKGIEHFLLTLGIASPVTKSTAGSMFHQQLAQQLADFLHLPVRKSHGAIALVDVYCIFNRARGIELVSPEDLIEAAQLFPQMGIKMQLRKFESGTLAIQSSEHSDEALCAKLERMTRDARGKAVLGIGPDEVSSGLDVPFILAREYLLMAETNQVLCRDDGPDGLRFYSNLFLSPPPAETAGGSILDTFGF